VSDTFATGAHGHYNAARWQRILPTKSVAETAKAEIHEWLKEAEPEPEIEDEDEAVLDASKYIGGLR